MEISLYAYIKNMDKYYSTSMCETIVISLMYFWSNWLLLAYINSVCRYDPPPWLQVGEYVSIYCSPP